MRPPSTGTNKLENHLVSGVWFPVEYIAKAGVAKIVSLGEVEAGVEGMPAGKFGRIEEVTKTFLNAIPPHRKIVILVPEPSRPIDLWRCRQLLKKDLVLKSELASV
jgi:hypothetical protein